MEQQTSTASVKLHLQPASGAGMHKSPAFQHPRHWPSTGTGQVRLMTSERTSGLQLLLSQVSVSSDSLALGFTHLGTLTRSCQSTHVTPVSKLCRSYKANPAQLHSSHDLAPDKPRSLPSKQPPPTPQTAAYHTGPHSLCSTQCTNLMLPNESFTELP